MKKKTATKVLDRLLKLTSYFNTLNGVCTDSNEDLINRFGYANRKAVHRDLKHLEDMGYIRVEVQTATPVSISNGTAKQYVKKYRKIIFKSSDHGLLALPKKTQIGDVIGIGVYNGQDVIYEKEDNVTNSLWIIGPDHTLIMNPKYKK